MVGWGYDKSSVRVKDEDLIVRVGGVPVVKASAPNGRLVLDWVDSAWGNWNSKAAQNFPHSRRTSTRGWPRHPMEPVAQNVGEKVLSMATAVEMHGDALAMFHPLTKQRKGIV